MATISAVIITKNEEGNIHACLEMLRWVHEIVVVDAESQDETVNIALQFTPNVFIRPWAGYGPQKNFGIERASSEWILIVDADERVTIELQEEIRRTLEQELPTGPTGYQVPRKNYFYSHWIRHGGIYPDRQLRLFKRNLGRYDDTLIHENLHLPGEIGDLKGHLDHYTMPTIGSHVRKITWYSSLAAEQKMKKVKSIHSLHITGNHLVTILKTFLLRGGWRDGTPGFIVSIFAGMYTFLKYVKAYETQESLGVHTKGHHANRI